MPKRILDGAVFPWKSMGNYRCPFYVCLCVWLYVACMREGLPGGGGQVTPFFFQPPQLLPPLSRPWVVMAPSDL